MFGGKGWEGGEKEGFDPSFSTFLLPDTIRLPHSIKLTFFSFFPPEYGVRVHEYGTFLFLALFSSCVSTWLSTFLVELFLTPPLFFL